ncbi:sigma-54 dependent transcriptional regulator [Luteimonas terricola]|uniref:sigma-54 dependent transcriptional regulator n=1 Tax=Luteimonas terricola TaxID=645597 RepID=UPI001A9EA806|nr:sigma-54 dependent transcriptional regulator [Luteimonas terricola]
MRDFIHWVVAGDRTAATLPSSLGERGWRACVVSSAEAVPDLSADGGGHCCAGLVDLRGCHGPAPASLQHIRDVLGSGRAWVAGLSPGQVRLDVVRKLVRDHCHDYVVLPCEDGLLATVLGHAHGMARLGGRDDVLAAPAPSLDGMIGDSAAMQLLYRHLRRVALTGAPVCIGGETGTGKELAAAAIHRHSARRDGALVVINCGAIPDSLLQSELFGFERGAFTGAIQRKRGRFEHADGGTLFLDEIGDLPLESQASLLRFLEQGTIQRLGGHEDIAVDARIICATHVDLGEAVERGRFRDDLYHRLRVIELHMPPLRERDGDIALLAAWALARHVGEGGSHVRGFTLDALRAMHDHPWPGNIRELVNRVRQAVVMAEGPRITARDLRLADAPVAMQTLGEARSEGERVAIERALARNGRRLQAAARDLGISRVTLYRLMNRHGLRGQADGTGTG